MPEPKPKGRKPKKDAVTAQDAQIAEAEDGYVTIEHIGVTLRLPVGDNVPAGVVDAVIEGGTLANWKALQAWVGKEQWALLIDAGMTKRGVKELDAKFGELAGN